MTLLTAAARRRNSAPSWTSQPYARTDTGVRWLTAHDGTAYGVTDSNTWATTVDGVAITDTAIPALYGEQPVIDLHADGDGFVLHTAAAIDAAGIPSGSGTIWVGATLDAMTNITPTVNWTAGTCGRPSVVTRSPGGVILVGQYSYTNADAYLHRSADGGQTWTWRNLQDATLGAGVTRHVHAVHFDPRNGNIAWATVGDDPGAPRGLYRSTDAGQTWTLMAASEYPIDFGFLSDGTFVAEGDGKRRPHIVTWAAGQGPTFTSAITPAMAETSTWQTDWRGTTRGLTILNADTIFYTTTAEEGAVGTRWGIWRGVRTDGVWVPTLLEELASRWMVMGKGIHMGSFLLCYRFRITVPL